LDDFFELFAGFSFPVALLSAARWYIFSNPKSQLGKILGGLLTMQDVGIFLAILSSLRPNGIFYGHLVHFVVDWYIFFPFWYFLPRNIWQPGSECLDGCCKKIDGVVTARGSNFAEKFARSKNRG
jgi:hypothetical protein